MGVVTDALASEGDTATPDQRTEVPSGSGSRDPFQNGFDTSRWQADAATIATGLTIVKLLGDLI